MRLGAVAAFEVEYRLRQKSTWFYVLLLAGLPMLMMAGMADGPRPLNAPLATVTMTALTGMIGMLVTTAIFGDAATRDFATGTHPLFHTLPLSKLDYVGGRFVGAFVVNAVLLLFIPLGLWVGTLLPFDGHPAILPFAARTYVEPFLLFALPNLLFSAAILFAASLLTRSVLAGYLAAVGLFLAYVIAGNAIGGSLDTSPLGVLLDPFGIVLLRFVTRYMSQADQDTAHLGLPGIVAWNRLVWLGVGAVVLAWTLGRFRIDAPRKRSGLWALGFGSGRSPAMPDTPAPRAHSPQPTAYARSFSTRTHVRQLFAVAWRSLADILTSRLFQVVLAATVVVIFLFGWDVGQIVFDTSTYHVTHLITSVLRGPAAASVIVLIGLYAGELIWRDRDTRVAEMSDTEPMPTWVTIGGKFLALLGMIASLQAVFMVSGMSLQAIRGYYVFEPWLYVRALYGYLFAIYALFAAVSFVLHVVINQKHLGNVAVVLFYLALGSASEVGINHGLFVFNSDAGWVYSDMNGFGPFVWPFVWFKLYWGAWAALLLIGGSLFWVRGTEHGWRQRLRLARTRLTGRVIRAAGVAVTLILTFGGFIFYNTNVLNSYRTDRERSASAVAYERSFGRFEGAAQPRIVALKGNVDIHPAERFVDLRGTYHLVNKTTELIDSIHVVVSSEVEPRSMALDRAAALVTDERLPWTYRIYDLERPLRPGDTLKLTFDHRVQPRGFPESGINTTIASNGAYFERRWLPFIGYQEIFALSDERDRRRYKLPARPSMPLATDSSARQWRSVTRDADLVNMDVVISTAGDQIAVTTGELVREWREGTRRYFHYKTERPIMFGAPFMSARYAVREDRWKDITLKVFYHPAHQFNIDRFVRAMKGSLEYYTENFGPYQFKELRIAEFPRYANFARGHPQTISFGEGTSFLTRVEEGDVDRPFFVAAHEIAHQWWGNQVAGARAEGAGMLSETLAMYSAMMVMERSYGREMVKKFYDFNLDMYLRGRAGGAGRDEMPLLRVRDQNFVYYHKGALAMYALKERIGEERVNAALRSYYMKWRDAGPPYATSLDLYQALRAVTPDSVKPLLVDLFETTTLWDVSVAAASAELVGPDQYRVTLDVEARKLRLDTAGATRVATVSPSGDSLIVIKPPKELEAPMDEMVEIGVYPRPHGKPAELEYLQRHRIRSGKQTITVMVKGEPWRVGVDPHNWLIQRQRDYKVVELTRTRPRSKADTTWRAEYVRPKHLLRMEFEGF